MSLLKYTKIMNVSCKTSSERCPAPLLLFTEMEVAVSSCKGANKDKNSNKTSISFVLP